MLPFQHELTVPNQVDHRARDTRAFRVGADSGRAFGAMTKRLMRLFLPSTAVFVGSSTIAYALNLAIVGAWTNSSKLADVLFASPGATSHPLLIDTRTYAVESCLTAWSHVTVERPEIYVAGLEQFVESGCGAP